VERFRHDHSLEEMARSDRCMVPHPVKLSRHRCRAHGTLAIIIGDLSRTGSWKGYWGQDNHRLLVERVLLRVEGE
jgi:hypothetical protein